MAVTLTIGELALELRVSVTSNTLDIPMHYRDILQRGLDTATALIEQRAPDAPDGIQNAAASMLIAYDFDSDRPAYRNVRSAWNYSGAAEVLSPWIERRAEAV